MENNKYLFFLFLFLSHSPVQNIEATGVNEATYNNVQNRPFLSHSTVLLSPLPLAGQAGTQADEKDRIIR